jgi:hypothetical protein
MCSFRITIAGQHVAILTGFTNTQTVGTVYGIFLTLLINIRAVELAKMNSPEGGESPGATLGNEQLHQ